MSNNKIRWIGSMPKIGIRPAIDGRRQRRPGVAGRPDDGHGQDGGQADLRNLRHPNGEPVECVIADTCIGGVAEAAACAEKFARAGRGRRR